MTGVESSEEPQERLREPGVLSSARRSVQSRVNTRVVLLTLGAAVAFFVTVGLALYFKPGSTAEPSGEPSLDVFAAGPLLDFHPGTMTLFEKEHFFLVRRVDGALFALYDLGPHAQARVAAGDVEALQCRGVMRNDEEMAGWLLAAGAPPGFAERGIWDECAGVAWDAAGRQVWGPGSGSLDHFKVEIVNDIVRVNLADRQCGNPVTVEAPCIPTR
jgi:hypothetical protein